MKYALTFLAFALSISLVAQNNLAYKNKRVNLSAKAGANISNLNSKDVEVTTGVGYTAGVGMEVLLSAGMYFQTGLNVSGRSYKSEYTLTVESQNTTYKTTANPVYLQIPLRLGSKVPVNDMLSLTFDLGPYFAFGIAGNEKITNPLPESKGDFFNKKRNLVDVGIGMEGGVEVGKMIFDLGLEYGFSKLNKVEPKSVRNVNAYFTVGYVF